MFNAQIYRYIIKDDWNLQKRWDPPVGKMPGVVVKTGPDWKKS
jgi:hypothetical protein